MIVMIILVRKSDGVIIATSRDKKPRVVCNAPGSRDKSIITPGKLKYLKKKRWEQLSSHLSGCSSIAEWVSRMISVGRDIELIRNLALRIGFTSEELEELEEAWGVLQEKD